MSNQHGLSDRRRRFLGLFAVGERSIAGELALKSARTLLHLHDSEAIASVAQGACIHGTAYTGEHLTLVDCRTSGLASTSLSDGRHLYHMEVFPHHVMVGGGHIQPSEACIRAIYFTSTDLSTLFYDYDAFGKVIDARPIIDAVLQERRQLRPVESGEDPLVCYFTGRERILGLPTVIGRVSVHHCPSYNLGGPSGVYIRNRIWLCIEPESPVVFDDALGRMGDLAMFLGVAAGRRQRIDEIRMEITGSTHVTDRHIGASA